MAPNDDEDNHTGTDNERKKEENKTNINEQEHMERDNSASATRPAAGTVWDTLDLLSKPKSVFRLAQVGPAENLSHGAEPPGTPVERSLC